jgi:DNA polymerase (family 10)
MKNKEIAEIFNEIADFLEINDVQFKPRAYRTAARNIESLSEDIEDIAEDGELEEIEGVGDSIADKITEYLETGELEYYEELKADLPIDIEAITKVEGVGPKTAKKLYQAIGVSTLDELEEAAKAGKIAELDGFGKKSQENILSHIELAKKGQERMLLGRAGERDKDIQENLLDAEEVTDVEIVGSFRRRSPTVGDIDSLTTSDDASAAMDVF